MKTTLRQRAINDGRITNWARTPEELDALGFHVAAEAARRASRSVRAITIFDIAR